MSKECTKQSNTTIIWPAYVRITSFTTKRQSFDEENALEKNTNIQDQGKTIHRSAYAMLFCVFCDAINLMCTLPNYPLMVTPSAHPNSFPTTHPLGISTAQYVLNGAGAMGAVISNFSFGFLADRIGSRKAIMALMIGSVIFTCTKYFARDSYWTYTIFTFINGLFGSSVAVTNGYMCLLFPRDRFKTDTFIGFNLATMVAGRSIGGLFTVIFPSNLFMPLLPAAGVNILGLVVAYKFVLTPDSLLSIAEGPRKHNKDEESSTTDQYIPEKLDKTALFNVITGALLDNIGSLGTVPLGLSPVMYQTFYLDFVLSNHDPLMTENQYRCLYSMIAIVCIPVAITGPFVFKKLGNAWTSVLFNVLTACMIVSLILIASMPATKGTFSLYASVVYIGFPLTILSNMTTGPMLDQLTPRDSKGFVQGINLALYDIVNGVVPIAFGIITDHRGWKCALWICYGISMVAALVNAPLIFNPRLSRQVQNAPANKSSNFSTSNEEETQISWNMYN